VPAADDQPVSPGDQANILARMLDRKTKQTGAATTLAGLEIFERGGKPYFRATALRNTSDANRIAERGLDPGRFVAGKYSDTIVFRVRQRSWFAYKVLGRGQYREVSHWPPVAREDLDPEAGAPAQLATRDQADGLVDAVAREGRVHKNDRFVIASDGVAQQLLASRGGNVLAKLQRRLGFGKQGRQRDELRDELLRVNDEPVASGGESRSVRFSKLIDRWRARGMDDDDSTAVVVDVKREPAAQAPATR
jgi:hypothetical protein